MPRVHMLRPIELGGVGFGGSSAAKSYDTDGLVFELDGFEAAASAPSSDALATKALLERLLAPPSHLVRELR